MRKTVLIADNDTQLCSIFRLILTIRGYDVETATDGLQSIRKLRQLEPSLLVLDSELRWGGSDGVLAWLREEYPVQLPVILMTNTGYSEDRVDFIEPIVTNLPKPFALNALLEEVHSATADSGRKRTNKMDMLFAYSDAVIS